MQVTSFYPMYGTKDVESAVAFFANFGFSVRHTIERAGLSIRVLENDAGLRMDVINSPMVPGEGFYGIRMNVPDLSEAVAFFEAKGGTVLTPVVSHSASELVYVRTQNGDIYCLSHHIKET